MNRTWRCLFSLAAPVVAVILVAAATGVGHLQDAREAPGPKDKPSRASGPHPLIELMATKPSALRPELKGVHPRVYVTEKELASLRERARTTHRHLWQRALRNVRALQREPPAPPAQERRAQNDVGIGIAEAALAYKIEGDAKYLAAAKRYMAAAVSYEIWGYAYHKPNVDLAAGHLLYGLGWGYDLLYHDLTESERARYRDKLVRQARLLADYYKPKPGRTYSYSQNHVFIPMAGLGVAAYALYDETPEAAEWAKLARAIYDRVLATYSADGYYYEGFEYWVFSTPWLIHYLDAHAHATGEDLYEHPGLKQMHLYAAHTMLPGGRDIFDFGDAFEGPLTRARTNDDHKRTHPGGRLHSNYHLLYRLASRFRNPEAQGVAAWLESLNQVNFEDYWSLIWYDASIPAQPIERLQPWHYFSDHEVVFWRSDWSAQATAFAFKAGPPEGHHTTALLRAFPDWHLSSGHAHPDANSFIIFARGQYLTGDSGYAGVPMAEHHNTLLLDGRGQAKEGRGHDAFDDMPYDQLNRIRLAEVRLQPDFVYLRGEAAAAYDAELGVKRFDRHFLFTSPDQFVIWDDVATDQPRVFTSLLHADETIESSGERRFVINKAGVRLTASIVAPENASAVVGPNFLTAAGQPGSVDKGDRQQRGQRLAISTVAPATEGRFIVWLKVEALL